ncbi:hypothetical protein BgiMline_016897, partial [Biomphalaria glabrata]
MENITVFAKMQEEFGFTYKTVQHQGYVGQDFRRTRFKNCGFKNADTNRVQRQCTKDDRRFPTVHFVLTPLVYPPGRQFSLLRYQSRCCDIGVAGDYHNTRTAR